MRRRTFLALLASCVSERALAQATVVQTCGSAALTAGQSHYVTVDVNGQSCQSGAGGGAASSVWSVADAAANGMTLSNGGLTFAGGATNTSIRGSISKTAGKLYVEFLCVATGSNAGFGHASASFNASSYLGSSNYSEGILYNNTVVSAGFTDNYDIGSAYPSVSDVWALAIDFTAGSIWAAKNNVWFEASNPATGALPIVSFVPATVGALFPAMTVQDTGETWTLQAAAASQKYAPPAGFTPWG